jgi:hypothetical protein
MALIDIAQQRSTRVSFIEDCTQLIDQQVAAKGGMSGLAIKTTYKVVKGVGPTYIPGAIGRLLPDLLKALDPMWEAGLQSGDPVQYLTQNSSQTADQVLSVTDDRIKQSSGVVKASYNQLRKSIKGDVEAAIPELARVLGTHAQVGQQV